MTPCKERGWKVGDKFRVKGCTVGFSHGQVVELYKDDGTDILLFIGDNSQYQLCDGKPGAYVHIDRVEKIDKGGMPMESIIEKLTKASKRLAKRAEALDKAKDRLAQSEAEYLLLVIELETRIGEATGKECWIELGDRRGAGVPDGVDVDDPKTWRKGDVIECVYSDSTCVTEGNHYVFDGIDRLGDVILLQDDDGANVSPAKSLVSYRFHHRPTN